MGLQLLYPRGLTMEVYGSILRRSLWRVIGRLWYVVRKSLLLPLIS